MCRGENKALDALKHENEKRLNQNEASSVFGFYVLSVSRPPGMIVECDPYAGPKLKGRLRYPGTRSNCDNGGMLDTIASDHWLTRSGCRRSRNKWSTKRC